MNGNKACFIICVDREDYYEECLAYLNRLEVPQGMECEVLQVRGAESMTLGYQQAMQESDAKYKIYLHQDVFITNIDFLVQVVEEFKKNEKIGMIGLVGGVELPENGILYTAWNCGRLDTNNSRVAYEVHGKMIENHMMEVEAVDGFLMATQYDIPWRKDLFQDWDFYDGSQSMEMRRQQYQVVIPWQQSSWCVHDCGYQSLQSYDRNRSIFLKEYGTFLTGANKQEKINFISSQAEITAEIREGLWQTLEAGDVQGVSLFLQENGEKLQEDTQISEIRNIAQICMSEIAGTGKIQFLRDQEKRAEMIARYTQLKFAVRRIEYEVEGADQRMQNLLQNGISPYAVLQIVEAAVIHQKQVLIGIAQCYRAIGEAGLEQEFIRIADSIE